MELKELTFTIMGFILLHFQPLVKAKVIERDKRSKAKNEEDKWHIHYGYEHDEFSEKHRDPLTGNDKAILAKVIEVWQNKRRADGGNGALQP